ncbi:phosphotransferase [Pengzhenrongella sp.]|uniref:phosphotransferase n=1 Tax=Pengzhenrongella sp. TaxID=2888820 RepID=UPI002F93C352
MTPWRLPHGQAHPPVWLHGDLHPANVVVSDGTLSGVIDFGESSSASDRPGNRDFPAASSPGGTRAGGRSLECWRKGRRRGRRRARGNLPTHQVRSGHALLVDSSWDYRPRAGATSARCAHDNS